MMRSRGNGYYETEIGRFDAGLVYDGVLVARTNFDIVECYDIKHKKEIQEWADEYDLPVEWNEF